MADVRDELSGVFEFEDCSGMSGLDVLLLEMVAETRLTDWQPKGWWRRGLTGTQRCYANLHL